MRDEDFVSRKEKIKCVSYEVDLDFWVSHRAVEQPEMERRKRSRHGECLVRGVHLGCGINELKFGHHNFIIWGAFKGYLVSSSECRTGSPEKVWEHK